jgi:predicted MFS family arabinose efflux permease
VTPSERRLVLLIAAIHFVSILDFMMVLPLGPDLAAELGIATSRLGLVAGAYTGAATVVGVLGGWWFDRLDRRRAQVWAMVGLTIGTLLGAAAWDLPSLLAARILAGGFGGPVVSLTLATLTDAVPAERRGRAMGLVMSAFAVASVLGVPAGLELARLGGWRAPFLAVGALAGAMTALAAVVLPASEPKPDDAGRSTLDLLANPTVAASMAAFGAAITAHFAVVSNLATWIQHNAGWPRDQLGLLYLIGGVAAFAVLQVAGRLVDRFGAIVITGVGTALLVAVFSVGFLPDPPILHPAALFVGMMVGASVRNVALNTLTSRVPSPAERGRYMSLQSTVQHLAASVGAIGASAVLSERPDGALVGLDRVAMGSIVLILAVPPLVWAVSRRLGPVVAQPTQPAQPA